MRMWFGIFVVILVMIFTSITISKSELYNDNRLRELIKQQDTTKQFGDRLNKIEKILKDNKLN